MTDAVDRDLLEALRAEAYRTPLHLEAKTLRERLDRERRPWILTAALLKPAVGVVLGIALVAVVVLFTRPQAQLGVAPSSPFACPVSSIQKHGSAWQEIGGPHAFFAISDPAYGLAASGPYPWLLFVRFDPDKAAGQHPQVWADRLDSSEHLDGVLNSRVAEGSFEYGNQAVAALSGVWYLFEQRISRPGCWQLTAAIDGQMVGRAVIRVDFEAPSVSPSPSPQQACAVTRPSPPFAAPSPYPASPPARYGSEWFGSGALWVMLNRTGEVWDGGLPRGPAGLSQKTFWWSATWHVKTEPEPAIRVVLTRLDGEGSYAFGPGTNAGADFGEAMLVGVEFPSAGCWRVTGTYRGASLSYVIWIKNN